MKTRITHATIHLPTNKHTQVCNTTVWDKRHSINKQHSDCSGVIQIPGQQFLRTWSGINHIESIVKKAQQRLYFLRQLRKFNLPQELLKQFYSAIIESAHQ